MLGRMLETKGMSLEDVEIVPLGKLSAVMAALESKQIDGAILNEPNITKVQTAGYGKLVTRDSLPDLRTVLFAQFPAERRCSRAFPESLQKGLQLLL
jgi:NitT/TauT family transport system substrate-binding protein